MSNNNFTCFFLQDFRQINYICFCFFVSEIKVGNYTHQVSDSMHLLLGNIKPPRLCPWCCISGLMLTLIFFFLGSYISLMLPCLSVWFSISVVYLIAPSFPLCSSIFCLYVCKFIDSVHLKHIQNKLVDKILRCLNIWANVWNLCHHFWRCILLRAHEIFFFRALSCD